jgi:hypothetical protein
LIFVVLASMSGSVLAGGLSEAQSAEVSDAERQGQALYAAAAKANTSADNDPLVSEARARINDFCDFKYQAVVAGAADHPAVYFLAKPATATDIIFGRHYKVLGDTVTPSTKGCFAQSVPPNAAAPFVTHLLSDLPTEFHVYLSLQQDKPLFVGTRLGVWRVEKGKIVLVQQREASGAPPSAIPDKPVSVTASGREKLEAAIAPYMSQAKASYPQARARFLAGLPTGERFFVVTRVSGADGKWEQAFVRVQGVANGRITGTIASQMQVVRSYRPGDSYEFAESDLVDWVIVKADGSEEGNVVGKFLDGYKP